MRLEFLVLNRRRNRIVIGGACRIQGPAEPVVDRVRGGLYDLTTVGKLIFCGEPFLMKNVQAATMTFNTFLLLGLLTR